MIAVELKSVSKIFNRSSGDVLNLLSFLLSNRRKSSVHGSKINQTSSFCALEDISFNLSQNSSLGIVGTNGSGKSTLLQIIAGTLKASSGTVKINRRVASLLELGSGFDPNFTGRENAVLNASIYGLSSEEIRTRMESIISFADIGDFIDKPVKTYSSGMTLRLAFSVIAHVDADILVIDEALAVGDAVFIQKCMRFIREFKKRGTLILVSHDIAAVQSLCTECIWLLKGRLLARGDTESVTKQYLSYVLAERSPELLTNSKKIKHNSLKDKDFNIELHSGLAKIRSVNFIDLASSLPIKLFYGGEHVSLEISVEVSDKILSPVVGFILRNRLGQDLFSDNTFGVETELPYDSSSKKFTYCASFVFRMPILQNGDYSVSAAIAESSSNGEFYHHHWVHDALFISSASDSVFTGLVGMPMESKTLTFQR